MSHDGFEIDRGTAGRIKVNVVSVANLIALIGLIGTAVATWNGLTSRVDLLTLKVDTASRGNEVLRSELNTVIVARDSATRELSTRVETIGNRLTAVETVLQRVERKLEKP